MTASKGNKKEVRAMFNRIAHRYDFLNHFLSMGIDRRWRKKMIRLIKKENPANIIDLACGTADLSIAAAKIPDVHITGIDLSPEMLNYGKKKVLKHKLDNRIELFEGEAEKLNFPDNSFDIYMVAFGVRNYEDLDKGLSEAYRVLDQGKVFILEFSQVEKGIMKPFYLFYFKRILPLLGRIISGDKGAYTYLPDTVSSFPSGKKFIQILDSTGFRNTRIVKLNGGIASIYIGQK